MTITAIERGIIVAARAMAELTDEAIALIAKTGQVHDGARLALAYCGIPLTWEVENALVMLARQ